MTCHVAASVYSSQIGTSRPLSHIPASGMTFGNETAHAPQRPRGMVW